MARGRGKGTNKRQFIQLYRNVKRSTAYHGLGTTARSALIELIDRYNGVNNGHIGLGTRELAYELRCSKDTAARALKELDDAGLAHPTKIGAWRGRKATEWQLTFLRCDKTGDFPKTQWDERSPFSQSDVRDTKVRCRGHRESLSPMSGTHRRKSPTNTSSLSPISGTHIHIYQGVGREVGGAVGQTKADGDGGGNTDDGYPELPEFLRRV